MLDSGFAVGVATCGGAEGGARGEGSGAGTGAAPCGGADGGGGGGEDATGPGAGPCGGEDGGRKAEHTDRDGAGLVIAIECSTAAPSGEPSVDEVGVAMPTAEVGDLATEVGVTQGVANVGGARGGAGAGSGWGVGAGHVGGAVGGAMGGPATPEVFSANSSHPSQPTAGAVIGGGAWAAA